MDSIILVKALPRVFVGAENETSILQSEVWMREVTFRKGECYLIEAESGTGKSSLCSYIYGLRDDYEGKILFDGNDVRTFGIKDWCEVRRHAISLLPQDMRLFPELTARENVEIKNRLTQHLSRERIEEMFDRLEIGTKIDHRVAHLSIGQQQRVAIVRALAQPFDFILLDEPVSHLDEHNNRAVAALIREQAQAQGAGIISTSVGNPLLLEPPTIHISL